MKKLQDFQKLVISNALNAKGLQVGEKAPDFTLPNALGHTTSLASYLKSGCVILKFYRGEWCPICNLDLRETQQYVSQFNKLNAKIIAISPQKPNDALTVSEKNNLVFEVLSDSNQNVIKAYNLQFDPGIDYHKRRDLSVLNGANLITLPVPATFIIDKDFTIIAAHVEANYTERMSPSEILKVLQDKNKE